MVRQDANQNIVYKKNLKLEATRWEYVLIFLNFPLQATCIMVDAVLFQLSAFFALFGKFLLFFLSSQISSLYVSPPMVTQIDFLNNIKNPQNHNHKNQLKLWWSRHDNPLQQPRREKARSCEPVLSKHSLWCFAGCYHDQWPWWWLATPIYNKTILGTKRHPAGIFFCCHFLVRLSESDHSRV